MSDAKKILIMRPVKLKRCNVGGETCVKSPVLLYRANKKGSPKLWCCLKCLHKLEDAGHCMMRMNTVGRSPLVLEMIGELERLAEEAGKTPGAVSKLLPPLLRKAKNGIIEVLENY